MPKKKFDVITIGSASKDVFLASDQIQIMKSSRFRTGAAECLSLGSKIEINDMFVSSGGGATNAAATFANLGYKTACIAKIGKDSCGADIEADLKAHNIDTSLIVRTEKGQSMFSTLLTASGGERTALIYRGVAKTLSEKDIDWSVFEKTRWVYLTSLGGNLALAKKIIAACKKNKVHLAWNPGMSEIEKGSDQILQLLKKGIGIFNVNREEAAALTGASIKSILKIFMHLHSDTNRVRIITDGANGAYLCNGASCYKAGTSSAKGISSTGAGDAFGSGVVASLIQEDPIHNALRVGTLNAESVIQSLGAKQGLLKKFPSAKQLATIPFEHV